MITQQVNSSNIKEISWEDDILYIKFNSNAEYKYLKVPKNIFEEMIESHSVGSYFHRGIKNNYQEVKL